MKLKNLALIAGTSACLLSTTAFAAVFTHEVSNPNGSARAGDITNFMVQYDDYTEQLLGTFTINENERRGTLANTSWMVLSGGANPKGNEDDLAILFMDYDSGTTWAYEYNGENDPSSYQTNSLIGTYENSLSSTISSSTRTVTFDLDVSEIQAHGSDNPDWTGASFGENIGVWYHPAVGSFESDESGLISYAVSDAGYYDVGNRNTVHEVPEISSSSAISSLLLLLGLGALVRNRRSKRVSAEV